MHIYNLILENVSPLKIAKDIALTFSNASSSNITNTTAQRILNSTMDAIGFMYYVSMNEVTSMNFQWPSLDCQTTPYEFQYEHVPFERYRNFIEQFCLELNGNDQLQQLVTIVDIFISFCNTIDVVQWEDTFDEPFSLICLSFLQSMHKIRKQQTERSIVLDSLCNQLFKTSQKGLGFEGSHQPVLKELCVLLWNDYNYFSFFDKEIFKFYCNCMEYEYSTANGALFVYLKATLENFEAPQAERANLVEFLTDAKMIKAYCVFAQQNSKKHVFTVLRFLNALLSHLPVLECFSRDQVHAILYNAFDTNQRNSSEAIKFYLNFIRRSYNDKIILRDVLDFLAMQASGTGILDSFIDTLWDEFPYIRTLDPFLKILQKTNWDVKILCVAAQVACRVFQKLLNALKNNEEYQMRLSKFLLKIPELLMLLKDKWQVRGILLTIYTGLDYEEANQTIKHFRLAAIRFVKYAQRYLKRDEQGDDNNYSIVQSTVCIMLQLMDFLNNGEGEEMEEFAITSFTKYQGHIDRLDELREPEIICLQSTLIILSNLVEIPWVLKGNQFLDLMTDLKNNLINTNKFKEVSAQFDCLIYSFAIKTYFGCQATLFEMLELLPPADQETGKEILTIHVNPFFLYLCDCLKNSNNTNTTIFIMESIIFVFCNLYKIFNFKLDSPAYHILINAVQQFVFEAPEMMPNDDRLRQLELQKNILHIFNLMHKSVKIPVPITWKICRHFGMTPKFEKELTELLDILYEYDSEQYKKPSLYLYVVPVAIFNLNKQQLPLRKFQQALEAHTAYVEQKKTERIMKVHIVLTLIDMIEKTIVVSGTTGKEANRLNLLTKITTLLRDAPREDLNFVSKSAARLENQPLTASERRSLAIFRNQLN